MALKVERYSFGSIQVDGNTYTNDILIYGDQIKDNWWRERGHSICLQDLDWLILHHQPENIIIGRGKNGAMTIPGSFDTSLDQLGVELIALPTDDAVQFYNEAVERGEEVGGGFHLTC